MSERQLERGLTEHIRDLILELGKGFAFVGSQYHLEVGGQDFYIDLLFYHLHLRCFVVLELKIEEFKPEFAGKMNFYLSAVDDQLRRPDDNPSIGIILCKDRNQLIVEYALRDTSKPMGVAQYQLTAALPDQLRQELPTTEELDREFPLLQLVTLRIEIERELRARLQKAGGASRPAGIGIMLRELQRIGALPIVSEELLQAVNAMNRAVHGFEEEADAAEQAIRAASEFLKQLRSPD